MQRKVSGLGTLHKRRDFQFSILDFRFSIEPAMTEAEFKRRKAAMAAE
jgi:hypothetical protein